MIKAEIVIGDTCRVSVMGHAGYDTQGRDIVCAGCSAVAQGYLGWLHNAGEHARIQYANTIPGQLMVESVGDDYLREATKQAAIGLLQIAESYPDHVEARLYQPASGE